MGKAGLWRFLASIDAGKALVFSPDPHGMALELPLDRLWCPE
jgi:hypothetical protein